ncbi:MAG TPA: N-acetyl-gamma-glutamyl-phosphate reductase [Gammaproteobacteria bacterium]|jgi:N-acetyl-gamma-glutamyl-phosphate reductase|nr:N-acetyl-gamma-glutamyl-phosphate reductase [Gammaproteobacteria bacterium]
MMKVIKAGILGATGYTGIELLRLLQQHPAVTVAHAFTESHVGQPIPHIYPHLQQQTSLIGEQFSPTLAADCDVLFMALPHGHAIDIVPPLLAQGKKVIDLGADFRLKSADDYQHWYQTTPASASLLQQAVYGLPEAGYRAAIQQATLLANPGCYPTASILAALPAFAAGIISPSDCIFDAKSGLSGAGRKLALQSHYGEVAENFSPYQVGGIHRHTPEIEQALTAIAQQPITIQFTPHLVPMVRGLSVTAYFKLNTLLTQQAVHAIYQQAYQDEPFIRLYTTTHTNPQTKQVRGTNFCDISVHVDTRTQRLIVISAIDNLLKGAAGQAIQNMNIMFQLPETTGLQNGGGIYP